MADYYQYSLPHLRCSRNGSCPAPGPQCCPDAELTSASLGHEHPVRRNVQEIIAASRRAAELTRQLLAFGRKQMQSLQLLDLNRVVREINQMLPRLIGEDIQLIFAPGKNVGKIKADPVQIEQIVVNLAANARDAMPRGGKLTIETADAHLDESYTQRHSIVPAGEYLLLAVSHTGEGIAPEHVPHIFEPFYTKAKGTGLGLAIVYGIVKQNGGFIWVYRQPGLGTTFKIYLPCVQDQTEQRRPLKLVEELALGHETLLLVEALNGYNVLEAWRRRDLDRQGIGWRH